MEAMNAVTLADIVCGNIIAGDGNRQIDDVSTNSKTGNETTLFVPIIGERVDAHNFIRDAYDNGMRVTFTMREHPEENTGDMTYIKVEDTIQALKRLGAYYREQFDIPVIGITGSVGKTTTKEMISAALSVKYNVLKTIGNMNSQIGLPQMMLKLTKEHEIAVIEMGMSMPGEMEKLAVVAKPQYAVITNIGVSHIGQLGSKENIREAKLNIINEFTQGSKLFINGEDDYLYPLYESFGQNTRNDTKKTNTSVNIKTSAMSWKSLENHEIIAFGLRDEFPCYAKNIETIGEETHFTYCFTDKEGHEKEENIILSVLGIHNVLNAVVALTIAFHFDIDPSLSKEGLRRYQPIEMRGNIEKRSGIVLVDDTYNASPDSMKSAIDVLLSLPDTKRKLVVFADVLELGELSKECHYEVGTYLSDKDVDIVVTIGKEALYIADAIQDLSKEKKNRTIEVRSFQNNIEASEYLLNELKTGDGIILKGSRGMKLDEIVREIRKKF